MLKHVDVEISVHVYDKNPADNTDIFWETVLYQFEESPGKIVSIFAYGIECPDLSRMISLSFAPISTGEDVSHKTSFRVVVASNLDQTFNIKARVYYV